MIFFLSFLISKERNANIFFFRRRKTHLFFFSLKTKKKLQQDLDIDAVILGGRYGKGKRGGILAEFLLGLLYEKPSRLDPDTLLRGGRGLDSDNGETAVELEAGHRVGVSDRDRLNAAAPYAKFISFCRVGTGLSDEQLVVRVLFF